MNEKETQKENRIFMLVALYASVCFCSPLTERTVI